MAISFAAIKLGWTVVGHHSHQLNLGLALNSQSASPPSDIGDVLSGDDAREDNSMAEVDQGVVEFSLHSIFFPVMLQSAGSIIFCLSPFS